MRTGIEPGVAPPHDLNVQLPLLKVKAVDVGDLQFATLGRLQAFSQIDNLFIVEIKAGYGIAGLRLLWFFFQRYGLVVVVELHNAIALRVVYVVGEYRGPRATPGRPAQLLVQVMAIEDVVSQYQRRVVVAYEAFAYDESLCQAFWLGLLGIRQVDAPLCAVAQ